MAIMVPQEYPPFKLGHSRFDQWTFVGRLRHITQVLDPRTLFISDAKLLESKRLLEQFKKNSLPPGITDQQLWEAQKIKDAMTHPDTGEKVPKPFRMSGFVPFGTPIVAGLLMKSPTIGQMVFWQWINQTHNALVNYYNRNATKETTPSRFVKGYFGAVGGAVSISVGLSVLIRKSKGMSPPLKLFISKFIPFPSVVSASVLNVVLMRMNEFWDGIEVFNSKGEVVGTSKTAARKAVIETAYSRAVIAIPIFLMPPLLLSFLERLKYFKSKPYMYLLANLLLSSCSFAFGLTFGLALFPQVTKVESSKLEPEVVRNTQELYFYYNKGL